MLAVISKKAFAKHLLIGNCIISMLWWFIYLFFLLLFLSVCFLFETLVIFIIKPFIFLDSI